MEEKIKNEVKKPRTMRDCLRIIGAPAYQCKQDDDSREALALFLGELVLSQGGDLESEVGEYKELEEAEESEEEESEEEVDGVEKGGRRLWSRLFTW